MLLHRKIVELLRERRRKIGFGDFYDCAPKFGQLNILKNLLKSNLN